MENEGIRLDPAALEDVGKKLRADIARLEASIYQHAGTTFNIASPKQLGELLFGKLALSKDAKKTKTGQYSTDEQVRKSQVFAIERTWPIDSSPVAPSQTNRAMKYQVSLSLNWNASMLLPPPCTRSGV